MAQEEEGIYVGSGSFRVDRAQLLDKLARFSYQRPEHLFLDLVRCAKLSGASRVTIRGLELPPTFTAYPDGLQVEFDGEPFGRDELRDPYAALLGESGPGGKRLAPLARALLALANSNPTELTLASGSSGRRLLLTLRSPTQERVERVAGEGPTVLRACFRMGLPFAIEPIISERCRFSAIPVDLVDILVSEGDRANRRTIPWSPPAAAGPVFADFSGEGVRGRVQMPVRIAPTSCNVELYSCVEIEQVREQGLLPVPVDGFVEHDGFALDASQAKVVRDEAYAAAIARLAREACALVVRAAAEQRQVMESAAALLKSAACRAVWRRVHEGLDAAPPSPSWWRGFFGAGPEPDLEERRQTYWAAVRTRWLRYCARGVPSFASEVRAALYEAPLYFSTTRAPLTLAELRATQQRHGAIPAAGSLFGHVYTEPVLWLSSARDGALLPPGMTITRSIQRFRRLTPEARPRPLSEEL